MNLHGDNLYTIPRTATGYVRREVRIAMKPHITYLRESVPEFHVYKLLRAAFRGGSTHSNRYYTGEILHNVSSVDIASSYPSQQCMKQFPITKFMPCENSRQFMNKMLSRGRALLIRVIFRDLKLRNKYTSIPYIPLAKALRIGNYQNDNGRILKADILEMVITDIDFFIIEKQYCFKLEIVEMFKSHYGELPQPLIDINKKYFTEKTALKGLGGENELYYFKAKSLLNAIYGMSCQQTVRNRILFDNGDFVDDLSKTEEELYKSAVKSPYTLYQYGVWTTCHARQALQSGIDICGDNLVYVDTDSCKYLGECDFSAFNYEMEKRAGECGAFADDKNGVRHYMGVYEMDAKYKRFITHGAKKYAYETESGKLGITVSGVPKTKGAEELSRKGGLEAFKPGFVFTESGKLESVYNDGEMRGVIVDGRRIDITRNVVLRPTTYALDITMDYGELLSITVQSLKKIMKYWRNQQL